MKREDMVNQSWESGKSEKATQNNLHLDFVWNKMEQIEILADIQNSVIQLYNSQEHLGISGLLRKWKPCSEKKSYLLSM